MQEQFTIQRAMALWGMMAKNPKTLSPRMGGDKLFILGEVAMRLVRERAKREGVLSDVYHLRLGTGPFPQQNTVEVPCDADTYEQASAIWDAHSSTPLNGYTLEEIEELVQNGAVR